MKRLSMLVVLLAIVMFFMLGCTTGEGQPQIEIDPESQAAIGKITGRHAGNELAKEYPDVANEVLALSKAILIDDEPDIIRIIIDRLIVVLAAEIDDPLLAADLKDIITLIKIETGIEITDEQMLVVRAVAEGLISGIEIYQQQNVNIKVP